MTTVLPPFIPIDLTNLILEYSGYHRLRNGKYMTQLTSKRLKKMNRKIRRMPQKTNGYVCLKMSETITEIITGPSFYYFGSSGRL